MPASSVPSDPGPNLFELARNDLLARYNAKLDRDAKVLVFPFGVDEEGLVAYEVPLWRVTTIQQLNLLDKTLREMGFLSL